MLFRARQCANTIDALQAAYEREFERFSQTADGEANMIERSGLFSDTTQRERADGELLRQKIYLDELFELAPDAVVLTAMRNPRILRINREFTRMFGYTSEEAIGSCLRNLVVPDDLEPIDLPEDLLAGGKVQWEVIRQRKDGTRFHAHITGKRIPSSDDEDAGYFIYRDMSARKQAEALFAGEKRLLEVIAAGGPLTTTLDGLCRLAEDVDRSSLVSILLLDHKGKQVRHAAGPSLPPSYLHALDGRPVGLGFGPCGAAAHLGEQVICADIAADQRWADEYRALALAHGLGACWSTPIKSSQGRVLGTFAVYPSEPASPTPEQSGRIEQLTHLASIAIERAQRHLAEEELQRIEQQLRQAQRLEALGTLAGGIAHDFNNLLGAILGYGEMALRNVRAGSRLRRDIENIMIAGERGHALVERILAFSRSGVGEQVAVHVEEVVRETLALFAAKLPRHIVIERRLHSGGAAVMGDPTQIHQVLMNLLTNAVQAMPSGGTLRVSVDRMHLQAPRVVTTGSIAAREYLAMDVSDSGSGIPAEIFEKIFDPFFTTKEVGVGTGLGLSLVHGIVTGLGGAIDVATAVGKGSVFKVYLPLAGDVAVPSKPGKRLERKTARTGRGRVMVIDDEEALVRLATETLTELGYWAVGFTSGAKAIAAFLADPGQFDAVITDESMPGASGSELIRKMRALRPTIPILLVSGYLSAAVIERAREAGASEVVKKPLSARQLQTAVERVLLPTSGPGTNDRASSKLSRRAAKPRLGIDPSQS